MKWIWAVIINNYNKMKKKERQDNVILYNEWYKIHIM